MTAPVRRFNIEPVRSAADLAAVAVLFDAYAASLGIDLGYQDFDAELRSLPGKYAPPGGDLLLARVAAGDPAGCVAMRPLSPEGCCEMKRLYVSPGARGGGLGGALVDAIVAAAKRAGYLEMRLDSLPFMTSAVRLYEMKGFRQIAPYYPTPIAGTIFMSRLLKD